MYIPIHEQELNEYNVDIKKLKKIKRNRKIANILFIISCIIFLSSILLYNINNLISGKNLSIILVINLCMYVLAFNMYTNSIKEEFSIHNYIIY